MFDVYQMAPGEVLLHTSACRSGLAWPSPAAPAPPNPGAAPGGTRAGSGPSSSGPCREGLPPAGVHDARAIPTACKTILLFSTYLQSAVQTLINDSCYGLGEELAEGGVTARPARLARCEPDLPLLPRPARGYLQQAPLWRRGRWVLSACINNRRGF